VNQKVVKFLRKNLPFFGKSRKLDIAAKDEPKILEVPLPLSKQENYQ